ncbi:MAG: hypothetical protein Kow00120_26540 [Anaerolineae bacterium]
MNRRAFEFTRFHPHRRARALRWLIIAIFLAGWASGLGPSPARAATGVVGTGTPASCTEAVLLAQLGAAPTGGTITFNCGGAPHTINLGAQITVNYAQPTVIDGGGLITINQAGAGQRVFEVAAGNMLTLQNLTVSGGALPNVPGLHGGGVLVNAGATLILNNVTVTGNQAYRGGGIFVDAGTAIITNSAISNNTALNDLGGGVYSRASATTITGSTLSGNTAPTSGGAITVAVGGTTDFTNSTVSGNLGGGAAVLVAAASTVNINYSTVAFNAGAEIQNDGATANVGNSIVGDAAGAANCTGTAMTSLDYNIDSGDTCNFTGANDQTGVSPNLGPLQDNGGPTLTHALNAGSPAIDSANNAGCPATDQRGVSRPLDGDGVGGAVCDIGAFEAPDAPPPTADLAVTKAVNNATPGAGDAIQYTITVANNGPADATGVEVADALPAGVTHSAHVASQGAYDPAAGVWAVGSLGNGASATLTIDATVDADASGSIANTATATAADPTDPDAGNNSATATINVGGPPVTPGAPTPAAPAISDPAVTKAASVSQAAIGERVTFTITAFNIRGDISVPNVVVTDALDSALDILEVATTRGTVSVSGNTVTVYIGGMAPNERVTITIVTLVSQRAVGGTVIQNRATLTDDLLGRIDSDLVEVKIGLGVAQLPQLGTRPVVEPPAGPSLGGIIIGLVLIGVGCAIVLGPIARRQ